MNVVYRDLVLRDFLSQCVHLSGTYWPPNKHRRVGIRSWQDTAESDSTVSAAQSLTPRCFVRGTKEMFFWFTFDTKNCADCWALFCKLKEQVSPGFTVWCPLKQILWKVLPDAGLQGGGGGGGRGRGQLSAHIQHCQWVKIGATRSALITTQHVDPCQPLGMALWNKEGLSLSESYMTHCQPKCLHKMFFFAWEGSPKTKNYFT